MDLAAFFSPISLSPIQEITTPSIQDVIDTYYEAFPKWEEADILLIGCSQSADIDPFQAAHLIRRQLYGLSLPVEEVHIADLGNCTIPYMPAEQHEVWADLLAHLLQHHKQLILLGGDQLVTYGQYLAHERVLSTIEYVHIDSCLDLGSGHPELNATSYNRYIFQTQPSHLFDFTNLGYQRYFVSHEDLALIKQHNFSAIRYGKLQEDIASAEPYLRTADLVSFDVSAIRNHDIQGSRLPSPGGFNSIEACRLARYTGLGYRLRSVNFSEYIPSKDPDGQGALLVAMMIWYCIEGYYNKWDDFPREDRANLRKYSVQLHATIEAIHFYYHTQTHRWWMEVPFPSDLGNKFPRNRLVPCTKADYEKAQQDDIPERWWLTFNKLK